MIWRAGLKVKHRMNNNAAVLPPRPGPSSSLMFTLALPPVLSSLGNANSRILGAKLLHFPTHISESYTTGGCQECIPPTARVQSGAIASSAWTLNTSRSVFFVCFFVSLEKLQVQHTSAEMQTTSCRILILIRGSHVYADS